MQSQTSSVVGQQINIVVHGKHNRLYPGQQYVLENLYKLFTQSSGDLTIVA